MGYAISPDPKRIESLANPFDQRLISKTDAQLGRLYGTSGMMDAYSFDQWMTGW
jgi:hypothetical protein